MPTSHSELKQLLERQAEQLCGRPLAGMGQWHVPGFDHGGLSGGLISGPFWQETALPLILERHQQWLISRRRRRRRLYVRLGVAVLMAGTVGLGCFLIWRAQSAGPELPAERVPSQAEQPLQPGFSS